MNTNGKIWFKVAEHDLEFIRNNINDRSKQTELFFLSYQMIFQLFQFLIFKYDLNIDYEEEDLCKIFTNFNDDIKSKISNSIDNFIERLKDYSKCSSLKSIIENNKLRIFDLKDIDFMEKIINNIKQLA